MPKAIKFPRAPKVTKEQTLACKMATARKENVYKALEEFSDYIPTDLYQQTIQQFDAEMSKARIQIQETEKSIQELKLARNISCGFNPPEPDCPYLVERVNSKKVERENLLRQLNSLVAARDEYRERYFKKSVEHSKLLQRCDNARQHVFDACENVWIAEALANKPKKINFSDLYPTSFDSPTVKPVSGELLKGKMTFISHMVTLPSDIKKTKKKRKPKKKNKSKKDK